MFAGCIFYERFLVRIFRAIFRLVLLLRNKSGLQTSPPIIPLDRGAELTEEGLSSFLSANSGQINGFFFVFGILVLRYVTIT